VSDFPPGYIEAVRLMEAGLKTYLSHRGSSHLLFTPPPRGVAALINLDLAAPLLAGNEETLGVILALDELTDKKATALQLCVLISTLELPVSPDSEAKWAEILANRQPKA